MEFGLLMTNIPVYISCKCVMYIFKIALVASEKVSIAFLYVLSIFWFRGQLKFVFFVVFFLLFLLNVPVNNFSVMLRRSHLFLGITSTFGE